jgi:DNA-binding winged helix-turn-helix (wHTH) protein
MTEYQQDKRIRFGDFEFECSTGDLQKDGHSIKLQGQPARLLSLLVSRPGEMVTRTDIQKALWPDGRFVEFEHAINTAVKKVREALQDNSENPRFIETLPKLGYRFTVPVSVVDRPTRIQPASDAKPNIDEDFSIPHPRMSRALFLLIQVGYIAMYCTTLFYVPELGGALTDVGLVPTSITFPGVLVIAMCGIALRIYLLTSVGWRHPAAGSNFGRLFPFVLAIDAIWAASPLLAMRTIGEGVALAAVAGLAYLPFAQRTLIRSVHGRVPEIQGLTGN